jgi:hypothetical protein
MCARLVSYEDVHARWGQLHAMHNVLHVVRGRRMLTHVGLDQKVDEMTQPQNAEYFLQGESQTMRDFSLSVRECSVAALELKQAFEEAAQYVDDRRAVPLPRVTVPDLDTNLAFMRAHADALQTLAEELLALNGVQLAARLRRLHQDLDESEKLAIGAGVVGGAVGLVGGGAAIAAGLLKCGGSLTLLKVTAAGTLGAGTVIGTGSTLAVGTAGGALATSLTTVATIAAPVTVLAEGAVVASVAAIAAPVTVLAEGAVVASASGITLCSGTTIAAGSTLAGTSTIAAGGTVGTVTVLSTGGLVIVAIGGLAVCCLVGYGAYRLFKYLRRTDFRQSKSRMVSAIQLLDMIERQVAASRKKGE